LLARELVPDPELVFENWQGLMFGEGRHNIWLRDSGEGEQTGYEIATVNEPRSKG
jgi:hypothetical protein